MSIQFPTIRTRQTAQGFTLVEIMVGMVIAMLGIIIMMQMITLFEGQKRTTTGGDDAQNTGAIALYGIQQGLQQAGYCFSATAPTLGVIGTLSPVMIDIAPLASNTIRDVNTNTILISYGNDACAPESASGVASPATLNVQAYAVRDHNLMQCDYLAADCTDPDNWAQIAGDVVSMRAECASSQAVRIALVTRSPQLEKTAVTAAAPSWSGAGAIDISLAATDATALALATNDGKAAWQYYRYKTFETLAPIRNTLWTGATGC